MALHELLLRAAQRWPEKTAVVDVDRDHTYAALEARATELAVDLTGLGIGAGHVVVIDAVCSGVAIAAVMACSKIGATFVPLSPEVPDSRARKILHSSGAIAYLAMADTARLDRLEHREDILSLLVGWDTTVVLSARPTPPAVPWSPDLAYVFFTSGSTGEPKGVAMGQAATTAFFEGAAGTVPHTARVASTAPFHFDFCLLDIGVTLTSGATLVPIARDAVRWPRRLVAALADNRVDRVHAVPSIWRPVLREVTLVERLPSLTAIMFTGEPFPRDQIMQLAASLPKTRFVNCYGPTECMACSFTDVTDHVGDSALPVDGTAPHTALTPVDPEGNVITAPGERGELHFTGPSVFSGYVLDGVWTPHPPNLLGRHKLNTGDWGHLTSDGRLVLDGRRDRQVKLSGNRVELGEIEVRLTEVGGVDEARVIAVQRRDTPELVAFVGVADHHDTEPGVVPNACSAHLSGVLPAYMHPSLIVQLKELPRTPNGKIDQQRLLTLAPDPDSNGGNL